MSLSKTIYSGPFVHCETPTQLDICPNGIIGVDEHGRIAFICRDIKGRPLPFDDPSWATAAWVHIRDRGFFFPGFVDTHIHASQYPNAGLFGKTTLLDWLETYTFPLESSFADLARAAQVYNRVVARTLSHGTTAAAYFATVHVAATNLLADVCLSRGQRAFVGRVCMDRLSPETYRDVSAEAALRDTQACVRHVRGVDPGFELVSPIVTPRFAPSCSEEALRALGTLAREEGLPVETHISENTAECDLVGELFPQDESYAGVYDRAGLLGERTVLAHAIHLSEAERRLIKERDAGVSHCPASNTALSSGAARVRTWLDDGLKVGLGTDVSGGYSPSILVAAREAAWVSRHVAAAEALEARRAAQEAQKHEFDQNLVERVKGGKEADRTKLSVEEVLYLATRGGAKVLGLEKLVGGFEVGMEWDAQMVSLPNVVKDEPLDLDAAARNGPVDIFGHEGWEEKVAKWVFTGDDRNTKAVWVKGRLVHVREGFQP